MKKPLLVLLSALLIGCSSNPKPADQQTTVTTPESSTPTPNVSVEPVVEPTPSEDVENESTNQIGHVGDTVTGEDGMQITIDGVTVTGSTVRVFVTAYNDGNKKQNVWAEFSKGEKVYEDDSGSLDYEYNGIEYDGQFNNGAQPEETIHVFFMGSFTEETAIDSELMINLMTGESWPYEILSFYLNQ